MDAGTLLAPDACQLASYPPTARYKAHRDAATAADGERVNERQVTLIAYLNDGWDVEAEGGALRLYPDAPPAADTDEALPRGRHVDVPPEVGTVLLFRSQLLHEVRPNRSGGRRRCALTMWTCNMA